jgi:D-alanine transaminase
MPEIAYVNGKYMPIQEAVVSIDDRGYQFADGVYEVIGTYGGRPYAMEEHLQRLERSLRELYIDVDIRENGLDLERLMAEGMEQSGFEETFIYIQITRGVAPRNHGLPNPPPPPTVVMTFKESWRQSPERYEIGTKVITTPDLRWKRCDIKSISLLGNILAKAEAHRAGVSEALLIDDQGRITEGSSTSAFCMIDGEIRTAPTGPHILTSITRNILLDLIRELAIPVREEFFTREELLAADEVFIAGTTLEAMPVVEVDGKTVGDGKPGPLTRRVREAFLKSVERL